MVKKVMLTYKHSLRLALGFLLFVSSSCGSDDSTLVIDSNFPAEGSGSGTSSVSGNSESESGHSGSGDNIFSPGASIGYIQRANLNSSQIPDSSHHFVRIGVKSENGIRELCTGTVIGRNSVLTAANCIQGKESGLIIRTGRNIVEVVQIFIHSEYASGTILKDLAILKTFENLNLPIMGIMSSRQIKSGDSVEIHNFYNQEDQRSELLYSENCKIDSVTETQLLSGYGTPDIDCNRSSYAPATYRFSNEGKDIVVTVLAAISIESSPWQCLQEEARLLMNINNPELLQFIIEHVPEVLLQ